MSFDENKNGNLNRRNFLKKAAAIGLGAAVDRRHHVYIQLPPDARAPNESGG